MLSKTGPAGPKGPFGLKILHTFCIELFLASKEWGPLGFLFGHHCWISNFIIVLRYFLHEPLGWSIRTFKIWKWFIMDDINTEQYMKSIPWSAEAQWKTRLICKGPKRVEIWKGAKFLCYTGWLASRLRFESSSTVL